MASLVAYGDSDEDLSDDAPEPEPLSLPRAPVGALPGLGPTSYTGPMGATLERGTDGEVQMNLGFSALPTPAQQPKLVLKDKSKKKKKRKKHKQEKDKPTTSQPIGFFREQKAAPRLGSLLPQPKQAAPTTPKAPTGDHIQEHPEPQSPHNEVVATEAPPDPPVPAEAVPVPDPEETLIEMQDETTVILPSEPTMVHDKPEPPPPPGIKRRKVSNAKFVKRAPPKSESALPFDVQQHRAEVERRRSQHQQLHSQRQQHQEQQPQLQQQQQPEVQYVHPSHMYMPDNYQTSAGVPAEATQLGPEQGPAGPGHAALGSDLDILKSDKRFARALKKGETMDNFVDVSAEHLVAKTVKETLEMKMAMKQAQAAQSTGMFWNPFSVNGSNKLTRMHKQKHHINQLAAAAAAMENELAIKKAKNKVTRRQTQAKYGW